MLNLLEKIPNWALVLLSALLLTLGWPMSPLFPLLFVGVVPLLIIEHRLSSHPMSNLKLLAYVFFTFFLFNLGSTWWIWNASPTGLFGAAGLNALLMCFPWLGYHITKRRLKPSIATWAFFSFWIGFEYLHHAWEFTWPWLALGNGLARFPALIQWYSITGAHGGSLWILALNWGIFQLLHAQSTHRRRKLQFRLGFVLCVPIIFSLVQYASYQPEGDSIEVVAIQPNIDPYNSKFNLKDIQQNTLNMLDQSQEYCTQETAIIVWPETAIQQSVDLNSPNKNPHIAQLRAFLASHPNASLIVGSDAHEFYTSENKTITARQMNNSDTWYDKYNAGLLIEQDTIQVYKKSKLVPGVESLPYPQFFNLFDGIMLNLGGTAGSLGRQSKRAVFTTQHGIKIAPVICYESVFGNYVTEYIRNGAQAIAVITNDGWWGNTPGHKQHLLFSAMRAIETRRDVIRSANTGVTCKIDQLGRIHQPTEYWVKDALKTTISLNNQETIFVQYGDIIGRIAGFLAICLLIMNCSSLFTKRFMHRVGK